MRELTADTFHQAMAETPEIACILHRGALEQVSEASAFEADGAAGSFAWTHIDLDGAPAIGAMFGIAGDEPWLMAMRESVVLYCRPLAAAPVSEIRETLDKAAQIDMETVRRKVAEERLGKDALFNRRACPTTWRTR